MVGKLTADVADLSKIIKQKDSTIVRLRQSIERLAVAKPESTDRPPVQSDIRIRPPAKLGITWPRVENWFWRGFFLYMGVQIIRSGTSR